MQKVIKQIPNFITSLGLFSGTLATFFAIDGHLIWAGLFICLAALFDFFDGLAARLLNAKTRVGKQLDALADIVSFGVAPGAILFTLLEFSLFKRNMLLHEISGDASIWLTLFLAFLIPVFGAIRLARFNANENQENFFRGLPIPANGLFWAALGLMLEFSKQQFVIEAIYTSKNLLFLGIFFSGLMVINLPMFSLKFRSWDLRENWFRYLFLACSLSFIIAFWATGLVLCIVLYVFLNVVLYIAGIKY